MCDVLDAMFEKTVKPGEFIIKQGDDGDNFYVIERSIFIKFAKKKFFCKKVSIKFKFMNEEIEEIVFLVFRGKYEVYVKDQKGNPSCIHTYDNSGAFGELALLYNMPRAASVKAITPGTLWAMDRQTFRRILLKSAYKKRKMYESLIDKVPMLKCLEVRAK